MIINQKYIDSLPDLDSISALVDAIRTVITNDTIVIFNNIILQQSNPTEFISIEVLKRLRITHRITNPVILVGFLPLQYILSKHPNHIILTSPGTRYLQLPYNSEEFATLSKKLKPVSDLINTLKPFVKADFEIEQFGHSFANRFGLYHLIEQHQLVKPAYSTKAKFSEEEVYEFKKASFIYQESVQTPKFPVVQSNSKSRLLYIDDQADDGWAQLLQSIIGFSDNLKLKKHVPNTEGDFLSAIKEEIKTHKSTGIILDLRLKGDNEKDKNIINTSGYKVLIMIKANFPSLPVLILSATNKAKSLKQILDAGALNLYTKPRIEEKNSLDDCYNELIERLGKLVNFYTYKEEKIALESDYLIHNLNPQDLNIDVWNYVNSFDCILTDTNCWMMNVTNKHSVSEISSLYKWLYLSSMVNPEAFTIIVEIQRELLVHQYTRNAKKTETELVKNAITAGYGLKLINKIIKDQKLFVYDFHKINSFGRRFQFNYELENDTIYQECIEFRNPLFKVILDEELGEDASKRVKSLNKRRFLYADDAFVNIIYNHIENPNAHHRKLSILLLSDDVGCMDNIHNVFIHKYPDLKMKSIIINQSMSKERIQQGKLVGVNSYGQKFNIRLMNPFKYVKKLIKLSLSDLST